MPSDCLSILNGSAIFEKGSDPGSTKGMAAYRRREAGLSSSALDHLERISPTHGHHQKEAEVRFLIRDHPQGGRQIRIVLLNPRGQLPKTFLIWPEIVANKRQQADIPFIADSDGPCSFGHRGRARLSLQSNQVFQT